MVGFPKKPDTGDNRTDFVFLRITCKSCQKEKTLCVYKKDWERYQNKEDYIQNIFFYLTPSERELIISKYCGPCFDNLFSEEG